MAQALHLANGTTINEKLRSENGIVAKVIMRGDADAEIVEQLFRSALSRRPKPSDFRSSL